MIAWTFMNRLSCFGPVSLARFSIYLEEVGMYWTGRTRTEACDRRSAVSIVADVARGEDPQKMVAYYMR